MCSESNLMLLVIGQSDEVFRKGIVTLSGKPSHQQDGELVPQRIILSELDGLFFLKGRDGQTVFIECKTTLPPGEENSKERREKYRLNTHL